MMNIDANDASVLPVDNIIQTAKSNQDIMLVSNHDNELNLTTSNDETPRAAPTKRRRLDTEPPAVDRELPPPPVTARHFIKFNDDDFESNRGGENLSVHRMRNRNDYSEDKRVGSKRSRFQTPSAPIERENSPSNTTHKELAEEQLRDLLARIGSDAGGQRAEDYLEHSVDILRVDVQSKHADFIVQTTIECAIGFPFKSAYFAALVGLINQHEPKFGSSIATYCESFIENAMSNSTNTKFTQVCMFVCDLMKWYVISSSDVVDFFKEMIRGATNMDASSKFAELAVYTVLTCLARCGKYLTSENELKSLFWRLERFFTARSSNAFPRVLIMSGKFGENSDHLRVIYEAVCEQRKKGFGQFVSRSPDPILKKNMTKKHVHSFNVRLNYDDPIGRGFSVPASLSLFKMPYSDKLAHIDGWALAQLFRHKMFVFHEDGREAISRIVPVAQRFAAEPLLVQTLFSRMLDVGDVSLPFVYWRSLMTWLLRYDPTVFAALIGRATNMLFKNLASMNIESRDRFAHWFGFHLSNFGFQWMWSSWDFVALLPTHDPKRIFVCEALAAATRLSYRDCVEEALSSAPQLQKLLPQEPEPIKTTENDMEVLDQVIKQRSVIALLEAHKPVERAAILVRALLCAGDKSISHTFQKVSEYADDLMSLIKLDETVTCKSVVLEIVKIWTRSDQHVITLLDRFLRLGFIDASSVIDFVFDEKHQSDLHRYFPWRILMNVAKYIVDETKKVSSKLRGDNEDDELLNEAALNSLEEAARRQKDVFLSILHRFVMCISALLAGDDGSDAKGLAQTVLGRLFQFGRRFHDQMQLYDETLRSLVFTSDTEEEILREIEELKRLAVML